MIENAKIKLNIEAKHNSDYMEFHAEPIERLRLKNELIRTIKNAFDLSKFEVIVNVKYEEN